VVAGAGNGVRHAGDAIDGALGPRVIATYAHGPVLARNPDLADHLLRLVVADLPPLDVDAVNQATAALRRERLGAVRRRSTSGR
jgi:CobQ-like glutamine amidotransferase family enzyme